MSRAVVVGGGIGGLSAAIGLRSAGWDVTVHEQAPALHEVGAGIALWANGLRALDVLGVGEAVRSVGAPDFGGAFRRPNGDVLVRINADAAIAKHGLLGIVLHRAELLDLLLAAAGPVNVGDPCTGVRLAGNQAVVSFTDGREEEADLVVGADGLHSVVRSSLFGAAAPRYSGITAWRSVVDAPPGDLHPGETWGHRLEFGRVPMSEGRVYVFAAARLPEGTRFDDEVAEVRRLFGHWHDPIPSLIDRMDPETVLRNDIYDRPPLRRWSQGCVTLLGDAAHPMTPMLGQGACQALEDAVALSRLVKPGQVAAGLASYEKARKRRANTFVRESHLMAKVVFGSTVLRDTGLRLVGPLAQPRQFRRMLD